MRALTGHILATFQVGEVNFLQYTPAGGAYRHCSLLHLSGSDPATDIRR
jgi:hypothetical protein